jgi:pilus assembly protein FimV
MLVFTQCTLTEYQFMSQKMRVKTQPKFVTFSLKTLSAAVVSAMLISNAYGAGLGKLTVLSGLGQPLQAEIELTSVSKEEAGSLSVKLASVEAFRQANIEFNPALFALRFAVEQRAGRQIVRITSSQPVNEPFVDMLLELGGGNSRLVREYTFLLDPPDLRRTQSAQVAAPSTPALQRPNTAPASQSITNTESVPQPSATEKPAPATAPQASARRANAAQPRGESSSPAPSGDYQVKSGDTLVKIAGQYRAEGISLDQMLIALQRANPNAFIGNNINRLRSGQILSIPDADTARAIPNSEAKSMVVAQSVDFNSYRNKLAERTLNAAPQGSDEARQSATGKITAKVEEQPTAASESKDKLKLSRSGAAATAAEKGGNTTVNPEDSIAKDKALAEANARVKELEKNVADLQKILEIKNKDLAERQKLADAAKLANASPVPATAAAGNAVTAPVSPVASTPSPAVSPAEKPAQQATPAPATATPSVASGNPTATPVEGSAPGTASPAPDVAPNADASAEPVTATDAKAAAPTEVKPAAATEAKPNPAAAPEPEEIGLMDEVLENPLLLSVLAALLAGLGGLGIYSARRKKLQKEFSDNSVLTDSSSLTANSLFGSTGGQSVDTNNSVFNSNFAPSASQLDTNEVDPVAEADVYIAYGRDAQAEEILKEALRTQPDRNAVRVKLLEIYANRKDLRAFEMLASELYSITKGDGEDWEQAASLGIEIDPQNPLYAGGKLPDNVIAKTAALTASTQPLDELNLDALLNTTQTSTPPLENLDTVESPSSYFDTKTDATAGALPDLDMNVPSVPAEIVLAKPAAPAIPKPETPTPSASVAEPEEPAALDFDFDLPGLGIKESDQPKSTPVSSPSAESNAADGGLDFDFSPQSFAVKPDPDPKTDAIPEITEEKADEFEPLELNDSFTAQKPDVPPSSVNTPAAPDFDLSGITLDLTPAEAVTSVGERMNGAVVVDSNLAEMATKLDLAIAYQEIGDKEGARELLDEVVKGGTAEQTEKARSILQKFA